MLGTLYPTLLMPSGIKPVDVTPLASWLGISLQLQPNILRDRLELYSNNSIKMSLLQGQSLLQEVLRDEQLQSNDLPYIFIPDMPPGRGESYSWEKALAGRLYHPSKCLCHDRTNVWDLQIRPYLANNDIDVLASKCVMQVSDRFRVLDR